MARLAPFTARLGWAAETDTDRARRQGYEEGLGTPKTREPGVPLRMPEHCSRGIVRTLWNSGFKQL